jgi:hypothetical protein
MISKQGSFTFVNSLNSNKLNVLCGAGSALIFLNIEDPKTMFTSPRSKGLKERFVICQGLLPGFPLL